MICQEKRLICLGGGPGFAVRRPGQAGLMPIHQPPSNASFQRSRPLAPLMLAA